MVPDPDTGNGVEPVMGATDSVVGVDVHDAWRSGDVVVVEGAGVVDVIVGAAVVVVDVVVATAVVLVLDVVGLTAGVAGVAGSVGVVGSDVVEALAATHEKTTWPCS